MNKVLLIGRLCSDPDIRMTQGGSTVANYQLAVDRRYKKEGEQEADFIRCIAFGKNAEFCQGYLSKGVKIAVVGRIQTGKYENNEGQTVYTTDVIAEEHYFCESKRPGGTAPAQTKADTKPATTDFDFTELNAEDDLPF